MVLKEGIRLANKSALVSLPSPTYELAEKMSPLALDVLKAWSRASWLSLSLKLTQVTPALAAPI